MSARPQSSIEISDITEGFLFSETGYLKFTPNSKKLFAASQDGLIYKFDYSSGSGLSGMIECSNQLLSLNERIGMVSVSDCGDMAVASENHELVRFYKFNGTKFEEPKLVTKCVGSTDALAINSSGSVLVCSGKDNNVKVINVANSDFPVLSQIPTTHFVRSVCFSEDGSSFALLQVDGILKIFKFTESSPAPQLVNTLIGPKTNIFGKFQLSWKEGVLGVLYGGEVLRFYDASNWSIKSEMGIDQNLISLELISQRAGIISSDDGNISIFSIAKNKVLKSIKYGNIEGCSLAFANESFGCLFDSQKSDLFSLKIYLLDEDFIEKNSVEINFDDKKKRLQKISKKKKIIADEAEGSEEENENEEEDLEDDFDSENDDGEEGGEDIDSNASNNDIDASEIDEEIGSVKYVREKHPIVQPGSTPWRNLQRFLSYNNIGFITARRELDQEYVFNYDVEFMDRSAHAPVRFSEEVCYSLASLFEKGAIFASQGIGACLSFVSFDNPADNWKIPMALGTEPILVGIDGRGVYVVNNRGVLNIYSMSGLLKSSAMCPGRAISMICSENDDILYLFTEDSEGVLCNLLDSRSGGPLSGRPASRVLLGDSERLRWCGLSFSGALGVFSSIGRFSMLLTKGTDRWAELLDTSKTLAEKFEQAWPVYFDFNVLSAIVCKNVDVYPDPYPAPHIIDFTFKIPEIPTGDAVSDAYEEAIRTSWLLNESSSASVGLSEREKKKLFAASDRHLLELAQISIKADRFNRLVDLAQLASGEKTIELLIQLAKHHRLDALIEDLERTKISLFNKSVESSVAEKSSAVAVAETPKVKEASNWSTPKLPDQVSKESPSGILANLTPMKAISSESVVEVSSPAEIVASPSNPFAKSSNNNNNNNNENLNNSSAATDGNVMLDYISTMMKMNSGNKRKPSNEDQQANVNKKSSLGSQVFNNNNE